MAAANAPITMKETLTLPSIGINPQFINFTHVTMESDKYICIRETAPQNSVVIIDMNMPMQPLRRPMTADSALMNPNSRILALKAQLPGTTQDHLQIFNIEMKAKVKSHQMPEQVVFWKWISANKLGLVTQTSVYHWAIEGDSEPVKMFDRSANLTNNQIINYRCDPNEKWLVLIGIAPGPPERPQLVKGNMQLFSVDQQRSQALEAHAASFATFKVPGNENPSTLISFATKSFNAGQITSKLHVIELGAQPGKPSFRKKQADLFFPADFADDFPTSMQISQKYGLIYVITKQGLLFVYDLETATAVYRNHISPDPIFLTIEASSIGGFYAINRRGQVLLATVNEATIIPFISSQLNNPELAVNLAKRGNLPGAENLRFQELFSQTKYKEAAELLAELSQGILRTPDTVAKFQTSTPPTTIDDAMEDEIFAKFEKLISLPMSRESRLTRKGKSVIESTGSDSPILSPEQISIAIQTLEELVSGDPANFYRLPDQPTIISAAKILSRSPDLSVTQKKFWTDFPFIFMDFCRRFAVKSDVIGKAESARKTVDDETAILVNKKAKCLSIKHDHEAQTKCIQTTQGEIQHLESELSRLREQLSSQEESANTLSDQRTQAFAELNSHIDHVVTLQQTLERLTDSVDQAEEELMLMRMEWSNWRSHFP